MHDQAVDSFGGVCGKKGFVDFVRFGENVLMASSSRLNMQQIHRCMPPVFGSRVASAIK